MFYIIILSSCTTLYVLCIKRFADMHNFTVLHKLCKDFIYGNFVQICEEDELGDLSKDQFMKFLNSEYLCVDSEQQVNHIFFLFG